MQSKNSNPAPSQKSRTWPIPDKALDWIIVLLIVAVAAFLRFYRIDQVPPGFNSDEAVGAVGGLKTLREGPQLFYEGQGGGGPVGFYFIAATFAIFGPSIASTRGLIAALSVLAVAVSYALFKEMFFAEGPTRSRWIAALAALGLALSYWHVSVSRVGFAGGAVLVVEVACLYFLWRGMRTGSRSTFIAAGFFMALGMSAYMAGFFLPLALALFFGGQWLVARLSAPGKGRASDPEDRPLLEKHFSRLLLMVAVTFALLLPIVYIFLRYPEVTLSRARQASITSPLINQGDLWGLLLKSTAGNFAAFGLTTAWLKGIPSGLLLPPVLSLLLIAGLIISIARFRRPPYLFNLIWWPSMILPSILSPDMIPHILRASGSLAATFVFPAIALVSFVGLMADLASRLRRERGQAPAWGIWAVTAVALGVVAYTFATPVYATYRNYFLVWPNLPRIQAEYHVYAVHLAEEMNKETNPKAVFILPLDISSGSLNPNYTIEFLHRSPASFAWLTDDEATLPAELTEAIQGRDVVRLIQWKAYKHTNADPKKFIPFLLLQHGATYVRTDEFPEYNIATYRLPSETLGLTDWPKPSPINVSFGGQMRLVEFSYGYAMPGSLAEQAIPSGSSGWARLKWRKEAEGRTDYKTVLILEDAQGHIVDQVDRPLYSNLLHAGTSEWSAGQEEQEFYIFRVKEATAPGAYRLKAVIYDAENGSRLEPPGAGGDLALPLGELEVKQPPEPPGRDGVEIQHPLDLTVNDEIKLLGYDAGVAGSLRPGDRVSLALYWQATKAPTADYGMELWLTPPEGEATVIPLSPLGGEAYPTTRWPSGEILKSWRDLRVPAEAQNGDYTLELRVKDVASKKLTGKVPLGHVQIEGRPRLFEPPQMAHEVGAQLEQSIALLGYDLPVSQVAPGEKLPLTLYWQALSGMETSYTVFVHLIDESGQVVAQRDSTPQNGAAPTSGWVTGEIITDPLEIEIPGSTPPGEYTIEVGMYDPTGGARLRVTDASGEPGGDRILLEKALVQ